MARNATDIFKVNTEWFCRLRNLTILFLEKANSNTSFKSQSSKSSIDRRKSHEEVKPQKTE